MVTVNERNALRRSRKEAARERGHWMGIALSSGSHPDAAAEAMKRMDVIERYIRWNWLTASRLD